MIHREPFLQNKIDAMSHPRPGNGTLHIRTIRLLEGGSHMRPMPGSLGGEISDADAGKASFLMTRTSAVAKGRATIARFSGKD
jgi:hypothetical protein